MAETYVYDKAKWHFQGDYPADLDEDQAYVHTGLFLGWVIDTGLYSDLVAQLAKTPIRKFKARKLTGPGVFRFCDGALDDEMLNEEGRAFARAYFDFDGGKFLDDYERLLAADLPSMYHVPDTWDSYDTLKPQIDKRYAAWRKKRGRDGRAGGK
jgi:hypothetical protein